MRTLPLATLQALMAQETGEVFLSLIDLAIDDNPAHDLHFVNDRVDVVLAGVTYTAFAFDIAIPDDREDEISRIQLRIDNVDRRVVQAVRSEDTPPHLTMRVMRAADPGTVIAGPYDCTLRNVSYDAIAVTGDLAPWEDMTNEPCPQHVFDPGHFPALFG